MILHASACCVLLVSPLSVSDRFSSLGHQHVVSVEISIAGSTSPESATITTERLTIDTAEPTEPSPWEPTEDPLNHPRERPLDLTSLEPAETPEYQPELQVSLSGRSIHTLPAPTIDAQVELRRPRILASQSAPPAVELLQRPSTVGLNEQTAADLTANPPPRYPVVAIGRRLEGTVMLKLKIDSHGKVIMVEILKSSGHDLLDQAAFQAVNQWQGKPARRFGRAVASEEVLPIRFRL